MNALVAESQISEVLDLETRAVKLKVIKDGWPAVKKQKRGGGERYFFRDLLPVKVQQSLIETESITEGSGSLRPTVQHDTPIPKRSKKIGLAKYNLVHAFRLAKEKAPWGAKSQAARDFLLAYNTGLLLPKVFRIVGEIRQRTLDALDKRLRENEDNYLCLCDGRGGWKKHGTNKYRGSKLTETAKSIFLQCHLNGARPTVSMSIRATKMLLEKKGCPDSNSESTYRRWFREYEKYNAGVICLARDGMKAYQDKYGPYITRDASLLKVGQCLVADGKTLNFNIIHPYTGRPCRMILIVFFDWASRYPVGWQIMPTENQYSILAAFRNSVETLGRYPDSVYLDNGRAFKSKLFTKLDIDLTMMTGIYARVGTAVFFAKPYNGRSKVVERFFNTFQSQFEFIMPSYCGDSIQTKPPWLSRNEKWQQALHKAKTENWVPNIREAALLIDCYVKWYAQQPHRGLKASPADILLPNRGPGVDRDQLNYDFLIRKKVRPHRCRVTLWKIDYESDCLHNLSDKQNIYALIDTANLEKIFCYTLDGIFLGEAYPVRACHPFAKHFGDQVALDEVIYQNKRQASLAKKTKQQLCELGVTEKTQESLNILPFIKKETILPAADTADAVDSAGADTNAGGGSDADKKRTGKRAESKQNKLSDKEVKRLEKIMEKAEQEKDALPENNRPKYFASDLDRYEWVFRLIHEHGRKPQADDREFMVNFESLPEYKNYRQRFEDLKLILEF